MMLQFHHWSASLPLAVLVVGILMYRILRGRTQITVHRDESADAVASLQRSRLAGMHLVAEFAMALVFAGLLVALQDPQAIFPERRSEAIVFVDPRFMSDPLKRQDVAAGVAFLAAQAPTLRIALMAKGPLPPAHWLSPEQAAKGQIADPAGAPVDEGFDQPPTSLIEAALASMSPWRIRRFVLAIVGADAASDGLGYGREDALSLHLRTTTLKVGGSRDDHGFARLGTAIFTNQWNAVSVRHAFEELASEIAHASIGLHTPIIAFCLLLLFANLAATSYEEKIFFEFATARVGRRIVAEKLALRHQA